MSLFFKFILIFIKPQSCSVNLKITNNILAVISELNPDRPAAEEAEEQVKMETDTSFQLPQLFSYRGPASKKLRVQTARDTAAGQYTEYLQLLDTGYVSDCLDFWYQRRETLNLLYPVARRFLSVPASSSPVERAFSHGGIIFRPHRASMGDAMLSNLVLLKCNGAL